MFYSNLGVRAIKNITYKYFSPEQHSVQFLDYREDYHTLLFKLASRFISVIPHDYDHVVTEAFNAVGKKLEADYLTLYFYDFFRKAAVKSYQWSSAGHEIETFDNTAVPFSMIVDILKLHLKNRVVNLDFYDSPADQGAGAACFKNEGTRFLSIYPMVTRGQRIGFLVFEKAEQEKPFSEQEGWLLKALAEMIACSELQRRKESERMQLKQKYIDLVEQTSDWVWEANADGVFTYGNSRAEDFTGYNPAELIGRTPFSFMAPGQAENVKKVFFDAVRDAKPIRHLENQFIHKDGQTVYFDTNGVPLLNSRGQVRGFRGISRDITGRKSIENALKDSEKKHREILASIEEGYYEVDVKGNLLDFNESTGSITGYSRSELTGMNYRQLYKDHKAVFGAFREVYKTGRPNRGFIQSIRRKDGSSCYVEISISPVTGKEGKFAGFRGVIRDVTSRIKQHNRLAYLSMHDNLTGVYNRTYFEEELKRLRNSREYPISIIYADVNGLKIVNDAFGHEKGDQLLKDAARVMRESLRGHEVLSRVGGDEFAAVLVNTDEENGRKVVARIRDSIDSYNKTNQDIPLSISIGLATAATGETSTEELFKTADDLMYRDKMFNGGNHSFKLLDKIKAPANGNKLPGPELLSRYTRLCRALGQMAGLDAKSMDKLLLLAKAHNIGNAGTPLRIILKEKRLTAEENRIIRMHPEKGYRIALASQELSGIADLILKHHEWWDGSGYPLGLKGEDIPPECRILAVVDAFVNMTTERSYRKACSNAEALKELQRCAGGQFDPAVVENFRQLWEKARLQQQKKKDFAGKK